MAPRQNAVQRSSPFAGTIPDPSPATARPSRRRDATRKQVNLSIHAVGDLARLKVRSLAGALMLDNLYVLRYLNELEQLDVTFAERVSDLQPLAELARLRRLSASPPPRVE